MAESELFVLRARNLGCGFLGAVNDPICVDARNGTLLKRNREQLPGARISAEHEARTALHSADRHHPLLPPTSIDHLAGRAFLWSRLLDLRPFHQGNDFY
jgi:hypothetical protein